MDFSFQKRKDQPGDVKRRLMVPAEINLWALRFRLDSKLPYVDKPTIKDVYRAFIYNGIDLDAELYKFPEGDAKECWIKLPPEVYAAIEKAVNKTKEGTEQKAWGIHSISINDAILCFLVAGFNSYTGKAEQVAQPG